jgi:hypothetical protein
VKFGYQGAQLFSEDQSEKAQQEWRYFKVFQCRDSLDDKVRQSEQSPGFAHEPPAFTRHFYF